MLLVLALILSSVLFVGLLIYRLKFKRLIELTRDLGTPPSWPVVGHALQLIGKAPHELVQTLGHYIDVYAKDHTLKVWLGPELNVLMGDPKDLEVVLGTVRFNEKAGEYKALEPWLKEGLLISTGCKWQKRRKIITPAFHFRILEEFVDIFEHESRVLLKNLERHRQQHGFDLSEWIDLFTMDTICGR